MIKQAAEILQENGPGDLFMRANVKFNPALDSFYTADPTTCKTPKRQLLRGSIREYKSKYFSGINTDNGSHWEMDEICDLGRPFDESLIRSIRSQLDKAIETGGDDVFQITYNGDVYSEQLYSHNYKSEKAYNFAEKMPEIARIVDNEKVRKALNQYYDGHFAPYAIRVYRNYHVPPEVFNESKLYSSQWHLDGNEPDMIKLFVALDTITEDHGPFHVISRDDSINVYRSDNYEDNEGAPHEYIKSNYDVLKHTGESGSAMLANSNLCFHRAGYPSPGNFRDLAQIKFIASDRPLAEDWLSNPDYLLHGGYGVS